MAIQKKQALIFINQRKAHQYQEKIKNHFKKFPKIIINPNFKVTSITQIKKIEELVFNERNASFYKEKFGDEVYNAFLNKCINIPSFLNAAFILHQSNRLTKNNWVLLEKLMNAQVVVEKLRGDSDLLSAVRAAQHFESSIAQALSILHDADPALVDDANFNLLANNKNYASYIAYALVALYRIDKKLVNPANCTLFTGLNALYAPQIAHVLSMLHNVNPMLVNDINRQDLCNHGQYAERIGNALSTLLHTDKALINDDNFQLLAKHGWNAPDIADALSKLYRIDKRLVNKETRIRLTENLEKIDEIVDDIIRNRKNYISEVKATSGQWWSFLSMTCRSDSALEDSSTSTKKKSTDSDAPLKMQKK